MSTIRVGTCGYQYYDPGDGWQDEYESKLQAYSDAFAAGELNRTFYELPQVSTAKRWRREALADFEFTLKAWQALTHPRSSPTWNDHRDAVPEDRIDEVGYLRPTTFVQKAWERTFERAVALGAAIIVVQTPPSFDCTEEHEANMRELLTAVDRAGLTIAWEPRGDWPDYPDRIRALCEDLDLIHIVDIMREAPVVDHPIVYTRLHGLNEDPYDYNYEYSEAELDKLAGKLHDYADDHERVYCMFNNYEMYPNAQTLQARLYQ